MNHLKIILFSLLVVVTLTNCEREVEIDLPEPSDKVVVDGTIESGAAPFVILTRNFPFFGTFTNDIINQSFVKGAEIKVNNGEKEVILDEICWSALSKEERQLLVNTLGFSSIDSIPADFEYCIYTLIDFSMIGEYGKTYDLSITTIEGEILSASTTIPQPVAIDSIWLEEHNNEDYAGYYRLFVEFTDPDEIGNFYRYYTKVNDEPFLPGWGSVFDDLFINGEAFHFTLDRAIPRGVEIEEFETFGYVQSGETVTLKWATIDRDSYDFWRTLEYAANSAGPLSGGTRIKTNINGGTGVWAGYAIAPTKTIVAE